MEPAQAPTQSLKGETAEADGTLPPVLPWHSRDWDYAIAGAKPDWGLGKKRGG